VVLCFKWNEVPCLFFLRAQIVTDLGSALQVYPVLNPDEQKSVDDAAVKLLMDWVDHRPSMPEDPDIREQFRKDMLRGAVNACNLLEALCTKRTSLIDRMWTLYLEEDQDEFVKACCCELRVSCVLDVPLLLLVQLTQPPNAVINVTNILFVFRINYQWLELINEAGTSSALSLICTAIACMMHAPLQHGDHSLMYCDSAHQMFVAHVRINVLMLYLCASLCNCRPV
jgi:hypothetical protein